MFRKIIIKLTICRYELDSTTPLPNEVGFIMGFIFHICSKLILIVLWNYSVEICNMEPGLSSGSCNFRAIPSVFTSVKWKCSQYA